MNKVKLLLFPLVFMLYACPGGGGDDPAPSPNSATCVNIGGTWNTEEKVFNEDCDGTTYTEYDSVTAEQNGCAITVTGSDGIFSGSVEGSNITWSGSYQGNGGTITLDKAELTISDNQMTGNAYWSWSNGTDTCSGRTEITAIRISGNDASLPAVPTNLSATAASNNSIEVTWTDQADNESGFVLARSKTSGEAGFEEIATLEIDKTSYTDTDLAANTTYWYKVKAVNSAGNSDFSNIATATTAAASLKNSVVLYIATSSPSSTYFGEYNITIDSDTQTIIRYLPEAGSAEVVETNYSPSYAESTIRPYTVDDRFFIFEDYSHSHYVTEYHPVGDGKLLYFSVNDNLGDRAIVEDKYYYQDFDSKNFNVVEVANGRYGEEDKILIETENRLYKRLHAADGGLYDAYYKDGQLYLYSRDLETGASQILANIYISDYSQYNMDYREITFDGDLVYWARGKKSDNTIEIWRYDLIDNPELVYSGIVADVETVIDIDADEGHIALQVRNSNMEDNIFLYNDNTGATTYIEGIDCYDMQVLYITE